VSGKRVAYEQNIIIVRFFVFAGAESLYRQWANLASRQPNGCLKRRLFEKIHAAKGSARIGNTD